MCRRHAVANWFRVLWRPFSGISRVAVLLVLTIPASVGDIQHVCQASISQEGYQRKFQLKFTVAGVRTVDELEDGKVPTRIGTHRFRGWAPVGKVYFLLQQRATKEPMQLFCLGRIQENPVPSNP